MGGKGGSLPSLLERCFNMEICTRSYLKDYVPLLNFDRGYEQLLKKEGTFVYTKEGTRVPSLQTFLPISLGS